MSPYPVHPAAGPILPYDVLQVQRGGGPWLDFATIRSAADVYCAWERVRFPDRGEAFRIVRNSPTPGQVIGEEVEAIGPKRPRCVLCRCAAIVRLFGFPVCDYHTRQGEDGPVCGACFTRKAADHV